VVHVGGGGGGARSEPGAGSAASSVRRGPSPAWGEAVPWRCGVCSIHRLTGGLMAGRVRHGVNEMGHTVHVGWARLTPFK
jgi:hypothetical protein